MNREIIVALKNITNTANDEEICQYLESVIQGRYNQAWQLFEQVRGEFSEPVQNRIGWMLQRAEHIHYGLEGATAAASLIARYRKGKR